MILKINKDLYLTMDRSPINFKDCEFIPNYTDNELTLKLTDKGLEQFKKNVLNRKEQFGDSNYIINFVTTELDGVLTYDNSEHEYDVLKKIIKESE